MNHTSSIPSTPVDSFRPPSMLRALQRVLSPGGFPYGSNWHLFKFAEFGRDSLEVAEDLLSMRPEIARTVICRLAELQGRRSDAHSEEEPGKIHHEHRALVMEGQPVDAESVAIFYDLAKRWRFASTEQELAALQEMTAYGTVDATPLFVRLIDGFCRRYGPALLDRQVTARDSGSSAPRATVRDAAYMALEWICRKLEGSSTGLLEWQRTSPDGARFQAWKDGSTSYLHPDGKLANYLAPMASIEVQGLAYDALSAAPRLFPLASEADLRRWNSLRTRLQQETFDRFWLDQEQYFALAIDRDPITGLPRQVRLLSSNAGALMDSDIFDGLEPERARMYISGVVRRVCGPEFLTPVGVRCTSLEHRSSVDYAAYQSAYTVWHKETWDIARGLRRQGFYRLARDLENRLLNAVNVSGRPAEFLYVMADDRVHYDRAGHIAASPEEIWGTNVPENDQSWTISACLSIKWQRGRRDPEQAPATSWQPAVEEEVQSEVPPVKLLTSVPEIESALPADYAFVVNMPQGWDHEKSHLARHSP